MDKDLKNRTLSEVERLVVGMGQKPYIARYIFSFIHAKAVGDIDGITPLSKGFRAELIRGGYFISQLKVVERLEEAGRAVKYQFELVDGDRIESVVLLSGRRRTLCVSTQVGCGMDCAFCATGKLKLRRNLSAGEIADQVNTVEKDGHSINNVVYMGMGEPLANYESVVRSVKILNEPSGKGIGIRRITISTCGDAKGISRLADEEIEPRLAVSLNAVTDAVRTRLMPITKKHPIAEVIKAVKAYQAKTGRRVTFEYVLLKGVNDRVDDARRMVKLVAGIKCNVNLIEFNPYSGCDLVGSSPEVIERFAKVLNEAGIETVIRFKLGRTIKAACGQLGSGGGSSFCEKKDCFM